MEDRIPVLVKPVFDVIDEADFEEGYRREEPLKGNRNYKVQYCYRCGSSLFYISEDTYYETDTETIWGDMFTNCATCGRAQGGMTAEKVSRADIRNEEDKPIPEKEWKRIVKDMGCKYVKKTNNK